MQELSLARLIYSIMNYVDKTKTSLQYVFESFVAMFTKID